MKRDLSLVREILLRLEPLSATPDQPAPLNAGKPPLDIPDYTDEEIVYHLRIMEDGGLISYNLGTFTLSRSAALDRSAVCICATDRGTPRRQAPETFSWTRVRGGSACQV
jgi:hypothetical protein